jgi:Ca-activated chloride channel homolog
VRVARRVALLLVLAALLLGLGDRPAPEAKARPALELVIAVDQTTSMSAVDDPSGSRIIAARRDLATVVDALGPSQVTVATFGRQATVLLPATGDRVAVADALAGLQVERAQSGTGSTLAGPLPLLADELDRADEGPDDHVTVVVLASDGEATVPSALGGYARIGERVQGALVLGYGTTDGGVMPLRRLEVDGSNAASVASGPLVPDVTTGAPAISRRDDTTLEEIADELGGRYLHLETGPDLTEAAQTLRAAAYADLAPVDPQRQLRWVWALLLLLLVLPELALGWRQYVEARREGRP